MTALRDPIRLIPLLFLGAIAVGTILLSLPFATSEGVRAPFLTAFFTSTTAVAVTGLIVVDTPTYWSGFGQVVVLALEGFSQREIGDTLNLEENTVTQRLSRARRQLQAWLGEQA